MQATAAGLAGLVGQSIQQADGDICTVRFFAPKHVDVAPYYIIGNQENRGKSNPLRVGDVITDPVWLAFIEVANHSGGTS